MLCISLAINKGDVKDTEIEAIMECIVDSLFSVFVTLGELISVVIGRYITSWLVIVIKRVALYICMFLIANE